MSSQWLLVKLPEQSPIIVANIYHPPGLCKARKDETVNHIISTAAKYIKKYPSAKMLLTGDFNDLNTSSLTSLLPLHQIVDFATCGNSKLDLVFTDIQEYETSRCICLPPILNNDHCAIEIPPASALRPSK